MQTAPNSANYKHTADLNKYSVLKCLTIYVDGCKEKLNGSISFI